MKDDGLAKTVEFSASMLLIRIHSVSFWCIVKTNTPDYEKAKDW